MFGPIFFLKFWKKYDFLNKCEKYENWTIASFREYKNLHQKIENFIVYTYFAVGCLELEIFKKFLQN